MAVAANVVPTGAPVLGLGAVLAAPPIVRFTAVPPAVVVCGAVRPLERALRRGVVLSIVRSTYVFVTPEKSHSLRIIMYGDTVYELWRSFCVSIILFVVLFCGKYLKIPHTV